MEDWTVEPFTFLERDGYYYGRGTTDDKNLVAAWVANLILYKQAGFVPNRDLVLVLEADEENGDANALGIQSLIANHRDLLDAAFALNEGGNLLVRGSDPLSNSVQTSEKRYTIFRLDVRNVGGHSSVPARDNAIYRLAAGLTHLAAARVSAGTERDHAHLAGAIGGADAEAVERLSVLPTYNAQLRTTCVATMLDAGHAENALPQLASATVNCRILPGGSPDDVQAVLGEVLADPAIVVSPVLIDPAGPASEINEELVTVIEDLSEEYWPGVPVIPSMSAGATDSRFLRAAGIPAYGHTGFARDVDDVRAHGQDERIGVEGFPYRRRVLVRPREAAVVGALSRARQFLQSVTDRHPCRTHRRGRFAQGTGDSGDDRSGGDHPSAAGRARGGDARRSSAPITRSA